MQSLLQGVRQMIPVYETYLIEEHNDMTATLRRASDLLADVPGAEADRIRKRAATMGQYADIPLPPDRSVVERVHTELGRALEASMGDLDVIQRSGGSHMIAADEALNAIRAHLGPRYLRDFQTLTVGGGMLGRG